MIDTHTHLYLEEFAPDYGAAVERALAAGVDTLILPNVDRTTLAPMRQLHDMYPLNTFMAIGHHPTEVNGDDIDLQLKYVIDELTQHLHDYVAVGEIGIDLYWDRQYRTQQMEVLSRQMTMAADLGLPVIIHCREGLDEVLEVIDGLKKTPAGVFHSFGGTADDVERIRRRGDFFFGINGIVTFKNSKLREVLPVIGLDRILLETDAPYLAPVPHRGKRNESAYVLHTAAYVASTFDVSTEMVERATTQSARSLFGL